MSLFPDQRSTDDQMRDLYRLAVEHGMYDAADVVKRWLQPRTALHHINGNSYDNRPENLEVVDPATHARPVTATDVDRAWTCHECDARITDVQPGAWRAVPCGHYVTHVQMVTMTYAPPSWPVAFALRIATPDTEETP